MNESGIHYSKLDAGFTLGPWRVEPSRNTIYRGDEEKHLENRLMQTLVYLAENQGQVISREQFFDSVWQGLVVNEEALSRAISLLRSALNDSAQSPEFIQTIPGAGYRLIVEVVSDENSEQSKKTANDAREQSAEQIKNESGFDPRQANASGIRNRLLSVIIVILTLLLGWVAIEKFVLEPARDGVGVELSGEEERERDQAASFTANSVAVLPFVNMSSDPEQEFFADGMTEELLNMLASVPKLRVTARTSSFFFKDKNVPISEIAEVLNVKHVLEGSIRRSGNKVRITAQLIEAQSDRHLWSQTYNREMEDIFIIQDEVASAIVEALVDSFEDLKLKPVSRTGSLAAFESYRTGRLHWWRRSAAELHLAIDLFKQAIEYDPGFAPAYAALADSWMLLVTYGDMHIVDGEELAEPMIKKALELDPESSEAYAALGLSRLIAGRKDEAEFALRKAIALDNAYIPAYLWMSALLSDLGRIPEEGSILLKAMAMDPLNELLAINYAENLQARGDNEGAKRALDSLIRLQPNHASLLSAISGIMLKSGNLVEAWKAAQQAYELDPENVVVINTMATAWMELGEFGEAEKVWLAGLERNKRSVELKVQYLTMLLIERRVEDAEQMILRLFGNDVASLSDGYQRTYHYFMGLLSAVKSEFPSTRDHFELVIDPVEGQLFDRNQIFVLTTASLINNHLGEAGTAEEQLLTAERVVGHARINGIDNADIYYSVTSLFALRGDRERALQTLWQAYDRGFRQNWLLENDGRIDNLRDEPAFSAIRKQIANDIKQARIQVQDKM